ncbi:protocatechuate 3,4-dioxygenase [Novosphingobium sp. 9U]|uniref:DODA-type extradiol aromatic ring-opening family dioxygenase n=1 Tax=Novosphingobium sp. 9U TaxID=2653158 RepID=UPI0012F095C4|nr:protocatechuate 3,4-dioxygenase [Novosphingobium sp. 9U]VWX55150.1 putative 3-carboxyethylcatechol 2,3-dioxygenase [Novosphingobium sp. 9U]
MGQIVGAFAMSHQLGSPEGVDEQSERVFQGMREIGRRIRALEPDVLVVVSSDHLNNFSLGAPAPFAVGTAETFHPLGDMGLPRDPVPGAPEFATGLLTFADAQGVEISAAEDIQPDHGVMIPLGIVDPARSIPAVPLYVNTVFYPEPSPAQCRELGEVLRAYVNQLPGEQRVVVLGAGGLSHWVGMPGEGTINEPWDQAFLAEVLAGDLSAMAARDNAEILEVAGNGGLEINAWIVAAAAAGGAGGEAVFYEAMPTWATGMAGVELKVAG